MRALNEQGNSDGVLLPTPWSFIVPMLVYMVLPSLTVQRSWMALVEWLGGPRQSAAGAALG